MKAENFIELIEQRRYDKISKNGMTLIAERFRQLQNEQLTIPVVSSSSKPEPPRPPLSRMIRTGVGRFCKNCNSTMSRSGFLMLIGRRYCDNKKCPNSKPEKNYY